MNMYKASVVYYTDTYEDNGICTPCEKSEYFAIAAESYPAAAQIITEYYGNDLMSMFLMEFFDEPIVFLDKEVWDKIEEEIY